MRLFGWVLGGALLALCACGSDKSNNGGAAGMWAAGGQTSPGSGGSTAGPSGGPGASGAHVGGGLSVSFGGMSPEGNAGDGNIETCAESAQTGKQVPLDMFIMLDKSGSMLEQTSNAATSPSKWDAVKEALQAFLTDQKSSGIGVGLQYFPLRDPSVPDSCTSDAQCGGHGPCFLKFCQNAGPGFLPCSASSECFNANKEDLGPCVPLTYCYGQQPLTLCHNSTECSGANGACVPFLECSGNTDYACPVAGRSCGSDMGEDLGTCRAFSPESACVHDSDCSPAVYAAPAVDIATLPDASAPMLASINAEEPQGNTPTAPAIHGALDAAKAWAAAHSDHTVVVLLATDGLPTECIANTSTDPSGVNEVSAAAQAAAAASPRIPTFVIGVFGPEDTDARMNLNQIAQAGGTMSAFMVDASRDVTKQFLDALNAIRSSELSCEYQLPTPPDGKDLDFSRINVDFTTGGNKERLLAVANAAACDPSSGGWYYDVTPGAGTSPSKILICPATCERFSNVQEGSVQIALGCATKVR